MRFAINNDGTVSAVYNDKFSAVVPRLGQESIVRATDVEYNNSTKAWEATQRVSGRLIASGKNRNEVIEAEVKYLEANLPEAKELHERQLQVSSHS